MGDRSSTAGIFIVLVSFLGMFAILVNAIPPEFVAPQGLTLQDTRTDWIKGADVGDYNFTDSVNITASPLGDSNGLLIGDVHVEIDWIRPPWYPTPVSGIHFFHIWQLDPWGIFWEYQEFDNMPIRLAELEANQVLDYENQSYITLTCPCPKTYHAYFVYNSTEYASWSEAYDDGHLDVYVGMGWTDAVETSNAWTLIWSILVFQAPNVFGTSTEGVIMNSLLAVPLWTSFAVLSAIMILWFIPLLGGE